MSKLLSAVKQNFWPVSALVFCPCHLPLTMAGVASLTAGTTVGAYLSAHYSSIETVLAVLFSFYFVLAFMIWVVRGPQPVEKNTCDMRLPNQQVGGLSTRQIITWGIIGMLVMPALVAVSAFTKQKYFVDTINQIFSINPAMNSGFIWLISLSTVVMIPVMVIWLVWLWLAWAKTDRSQGDRESWSYEVE